MRLSGERGTLTVSSFVQQSRFDPATCNGRSLGMRLLVALARPGRVWVDPADGRRILVRLLDRAAPGAN